MRIRRRRRVRFSPSVHYFKPQGIPLRELEEIVLLNDELEALKLHDIDGLEQVPASEKMGISQPTFARILDSAYKKIAQAIVDGKAIRIQKRKQWEQATAHLKKEEVKSMKVVISLNDDNPNGEVSQVFGRCLYFLVVEIKDGQVEKQVVANKHQQKPGGAGIGAAQQATELGAQAVISQHVGPRALDILHQFGIEAYSGKGKVDEVLEDFKNKKLEVING